MFSHIHHCKHSKEEQLDHANPFVNPRSIIKFIWKLCLKVKLCVYPLMCVLMVFWVFFLFLEVKGAFCNAIASAA